MRIWKIANIPLRVNPGQLFGVLANYAAHYRHPLDSPEGLYFHYTNIMSILTLMTVSDLQVVAVGHHPCCQIDTVPLFKLF